jgi:photosystem II stability/assembly factor-like uncharacterized protein
VFNDNDPTAFYDALKFTDNNFGLAFSDPSANQRLNISQTRNGGSKWIHCNDCKDFPYLEKGEAAFAAVIPISQVLEMLFGLQPAE